MSKPARVVCCFLIFLGACHYTAGVAASQTFEAEVEVIAGDSVLVKGKFADFERRKNPRSFAIELGRSGPEAARMITDLALYDSVGQSILYRTLMPGEFLAEKDISAWVYKVHLSPSADRSAAAHSSWIKDGTGILMWRDLMPVGVRAVRICQKLPKERLCESPRFDEVLVGVRPVGPGWTERTPGSSLQVFINGEWQFTGVQLSEMMVQVYDAHTKLFREKAPFERVLIAKFPVPTPTGQWEAETRGGNIVIISSDMPFRTQSLQRLHEQLRHEIFHLWIPNNVSLTGNYDWFYEGFALYQSLKLAVELNRIRFEDFLDTLSRAHTIDSAYTQRPSLIDASRNRFSGTNTQVYARGMLVAFLTDLALMEHSKSSVEELLRTLYQKHRKPATAVDGNDAVIGLMKANPSVEPIVRNYIEGKATIDWKPELNAAGIEDADPGPLTTLRVLEKPSKRQKTLLDKLGYNNWRKLSPDSK